MARTNISGRSTSPAVSSISSIPGAGVGAGAHNVKV